MARLVNKLSALKVANISKRGWYSDGNGLWLQVSSSGSKSWVFRFNFAGTRHHMGLGALRDISLAQARTLTQDLARRLHDGHNPLADRRHLDAVRDAENARQMTFDTCAQAFIKAHRASWRNPKHAKQWETTLATYASPVFGALSVADVDTAMVVKVLEPIWAERTETAVRLRGRIESILDWATVSKFRSGDNPARWRGHLDYLLANPAKVAPVVNHPALPWVDAPAFINELRDRGGVAARALEFAILTAARSGEVRGARWAEIDWEAALWTVPAERMKSGREHRVSSSYSYYSYYYCQKAASEVRRCRRSRGPPIFKRFAQRCALGYPPCHPRYQSRSRTRRSRPAVGYPYWSPCERNRAGRGRRFSFSVWPDSA